MLKLYPRNRQMVKVVTLVAKSRSFFILNNGGLSAVITKCCLLWCAFFCFTCVSLFSTSTSVFAKAVLFSRGRSTYRWAQTVPVETVRALILCIMPSPISKSFVRLKMAFCFQLNRQAAVSYIGQSTLYIIFEENKGILFFINFKNSGLINRQVDTLFEFSA